MGGCWGGVSSRLNDKHDVLLVCVLHRYIDDAIIETRKGLCNYLVAMQPVRMSNFEACTYLYIDSCVCTHMYDVYTSLLGVLAIAVLVFKCEMCVCFQVHNGTFVVQVQVHRYIRTHRRFCFIVLVLLTSSSAFGNSAYVQTSLFVNSNVNFV